MSFPKLNVQVYGDGAEKNAMLKRASEGFVQGFTTNPTLMAKAGIRDYKAFALDVLSSIKTHPISFEVFSDDFSEMHREAMEIASWGSNVNVKIPVTNTKGASSIELIRELLQAKLKLNVTAIMTQPQLDQLKSALSPQDDVIVSIFAGRIADTGKDPIPFMRKAVADFSALKNAKILWASPREALNIYQADECGCHIITATDDLISKLGSHNKDLTQFSLETVAMFYNDAQKAGFKL